MVKDFNCALVTMEALQDATWMRDDYILKAVAGLKGGVDAAGSLECLEISGRDFLNLSDFETFAPSSEKCREVIELASDLSCWAIERWN